MALDDLLAKLERDPALHDSGVTRVTGVTPSNGKGFAVTPTTCERVTGVTPGRADAGPVTPVTPTDDEGVTTKAAPILECTPVTHVTPQRDNGQGATAGTWMMHFPDREPLEVWTSPPATHGEALALYPEAIAAVPIPARTSTRGASTSERAELLALISAIYADDTDLDRAEATDAALADPEAALACYRAIAAERGITVVLPVITKPTSITVVTGCKTCRHRKRPGLSAGYCGGGRDDLPGAYGINHPLRKLPDDQGAGCTIYNPHEG